ncbi:MAG: methyl-accepting chemotaxis protein [Candidatus Thiodiazotropha sp.]
MKFFWLNKTIKNSLSNMISVISKISSNKDLTLRVNEGKDELGEMGGYFNTMMDSIQEVVHEVSSASTQLATAAEELSTITAQSNESVQIQKREVDQSATAMNQMNASMPEVAANIAKAVTDAEHESNESRGIVDTTTQSIQQLARDVKHAANVIRGDAKLSLTTISEGISRINDMATQIASAAEEQSVVSEEINRSIMNINDTVAEVSEGARQTDVASDNIAQLA